MYITVKLRRLGIVSLALSGAGSLLLVFAFTVMDWKKFCSSQISGGVVSSVSGGDLRRYAATPQTVS